MSNNLDFSQIMNSVRSNNRSSKYQKFTTSEAEFKEFERWFKFKPRLKYSWFHLKLYSIFPDLSRCLIETAAEIKEFEPRLKFGWFHLKSYSMFQYLSWRSIKTGFWWI